MSAPGNQSTQPLPPPVVRKAWRLDQLVAGAISSAVTVGMCGLAAVLAPDSLREYGLGLFVVGPGMLGLLASLILGWKTPSRLGSDMVATSYAVLFGLVGLLIAQSEGALCIVLASPLLLGFAFLGANIGNLIQRQRWQRRGYQGLFVSLLVFAPIAMIADRSQPSTPETRMVSTSIIVNAEPEKVWPMLIDLRDMPAPKFWMFRMGVAYPIGVRTEGNLRHCLLSTGDMPERITEMQPNRLLRLDVIRTPQSMKETNPFGEVRAPHLSGHFEVERVEFRLEPLDGGKTRLTGTSWFHHRFAPDWYWSIWTDSVVKHVQERVFDEIAARLN